MRFDNLVQWNVCRHSRKSANRETSRRLEEAIFTVDGGKTAAKEKKGVAARSATP
jgi:hypothetical protein